MRLYNKVPYFRAHLPSPVLKGVTRSQCSLADPQGQASYRWKNSTRRLVDLPEAGNSIGPRVSTPGVWPERRKAYE